MGRIVTTVDVQNTTEPRFSKKLDALVDTGASRLTLPSAWKEQFGAFEAEEVIELQTATQESIKGTVCGPVRITVEGFRPVHNEVFFIDMEPEDGTYEPLLGYIALEQCGRGRGPHRPSSGARQVHGRQDHARPDGRGR